MCYTKRAFVGNFGTANALGIKAESSEAKIHISKEFQLIFSQIKIAYKSGETLVKHVINLINLFP